MTNWPAMKKHIVSLVFGISAVLLSAYEIKAQCCAMGNPFNNTSVGGTLEKNQVRAALVYKTGLFETYFRGRVRLINYGMYSQLGYQYGSFTLSYGITPRLTIEHEAGFFFEKHTRFADPELNRLARSGHGLANGTVTGRFAVYENLQHQFEIDVAAGLRYPFSTEAMDVDGVVLPIEAQPSTGAFGALFFVQMHKEWMGIQTTLQQRYEFNAPNYIDYIFGDAHTTTLSLSGRINRVITGSMFIRNEIRSSDQSPTGARLASQGSHIVLATPMVTVLIPGNFTLSLFGDLPVYRYYFGEQISNRYAFGVNLIWTGWVKNQSADSPLTEKTR